MARGRNPGHVIADFGNQHACRGVTQARHRGQQRYRRAKRGQRRPDVPLQLVNGGLERLDLRHMQVEQKR
jgi:hypothetical protein